MSIPYRTQQGLKHLAVVLLILAAVAALILLCWFLWLDRYVVYTREGVKLDFTQSIENFQGEQALPPAEVETIPIYYNEGDDAVEEVTTELTKITGYYIDTAALQTSIRDIKEQVKQLPAGTPVMVEVKNSYGSFYYHTAAGASTTETVSLTEMDELIQLMNSLDLYTIARLPALRDYYFGLHNTRCGLPTAGGYLWADSDYKYWLNPGKEGTISYLISIANELNELGFDEVLFTEFEFPDTNKIVFKGDKTETLKEAAQTLVANCATSDFAVSFEGSDGFIPPVGRSRVYMLDAEAIAADSLAASSGVTDTAVNLVFVTDLYDTRFDIYSVLRPLSSAI